MWTDESGSVGQPPTGGALQFKQASKAIDNDGMDSNEEKIDSFIKCLG